MSGPYMFYSIQWLNVPLRSAAFLVTFGALALLPMTVFESQSTLLMVEVVTVTVMGL